MNLKKNILQVFSANLLQLMTSIIVGFFVPAILSIEGYAVLKTYTLYITYVGFTHMGFVDGMYIKYGGKDYKDITLSDIKAEHRFMLIEQVLVTILILGTALIFKQLMWVLIGMSIIPINLYSFHRMFYQATGQFDKYTKYAYIYTICYFAFNLILAIFLKCNNEWLYCFANLGANIVVFVILEFKFYHQTKTVPSVISKSILNNIKVGIFILIGNLAVNIFYSIDQWFVKGALTAVDFAYYAFSVSMMSLINVLINSVAVTFYNHLAKETGKKDIIDIKRILILIGTFASIGFFVLSAIVHIILPKYIPSLEVIAISFAAFPYMMVINALYVNLYKVEKQERRYLREVILMLVIATVLNTIAVIIFGNIEGIAMATTLSFLIWYFYGMLHFRFLKSDIKEILYLVSCLVLFLICSHMFTWWIGGIIYLLGVVVVDVLLYGKFICKYIINKQFHE